MEETMKLAVASDLHLEFCDIVINNEENADVLILAGDICTVKHYHSNPELGLAYDEFFKNVSEQFKQVIYVVGNHEHYNYTFNHTVSDLKYKLAKYANIAVLDNETIVGDEVTFIGGTLWTSMNGEDPFTMQAIVPCMPDWRIIKYFDGVNYYKYTPEQSVREHRKTVDYINIIVKENPGHKFVVVTHHTPSKQSQHEKFAHDIIGNGAFNSNLDDFIVYRPQIKAWIHGHTHDPFDYMINDTRVVCNPRGYPKENQHSSFKLKYLEV